MLSHKLTRITLKMADFEEYDQLKKERERAMDTSSPQAVDSCSHTEKFQPNTNPPSSVTAAAGGGGGGGGVEGGGGGGGGGVGGEGGGGIEGRRPVRASTPDSPTT